MNIKLRELHVKLFVKRL